MRGFGGHSTRGDYLGFYSTEDAARIRKWLLENGVALDDEKTWELRS